MKIRCESWLFLLLLVMAIPNYVWGSEVDSENQNASQFEIGFLPIIGDEPETGLMFGGILFCSDENSEYMVNVVLSEKDYLMAGLEVEKEIEDGHALMLMEMRYKDWPEEFYGIGMKNTSDKGEVYRSIESELEFSYLVNLNDKFYLGPSLYYNNFKVKNKLSDGLLNTSNIIGNKGVEVLGIGLHLLRDRRDSEMAPTCGDYLSIKTHLYQKSLGSDSDFSQFNLDYRYFFEIRPSHVLGFQGVLALSAGKVPFQMLPTLGGENMMRGFEEKYRDNNYIALQGEYRFPIYKSLSGVTFLGVGEVFSNQNGFRTDDLKVAGGFGLRYMLDKEEKLNLRLDVGFSEDGSNFYVTYAEAF